MLSIVGGECNILHNNCCDGKKWNWAQFLWCIYYFFVFIYNIVIETRQHRKCKRQLIITYIHTHKLSQTSRTRYERNNKNSNIGKFKRVVKCAAIILDLESFNSIQLLIGTWAIPSSSSDEMITLHSSTRLQVALFRSLSFGQLA